MRKKNAIRADVKRLEAKVDRLLAILDPKPEMRHLSSEWNGMTILPESRTTISMSGQSGVTINGQPATGAAIEQFFAECGVRP